MDRAYLVHTMLFILIRKTILEILMCICVLNQEGSSTAGPVKAGNFIMRG
jgi:hypothetical protein